MRLKYVVYESTRAPLRVDFGKQGDARIPRTGRYP